MEVSMVRLEVTKDKTYLNVMCPVEEKEQSIMWCLAYSQFISSIVTFGTLTKREIWLLANPKFIQCRGKS